MPVLHLSNLIFVFVWPICGRTIKTIWKTKKGVIICRFLTHLSVILVSNNHEQTFVQNGVVSKMFFTSTQPRWVPPWRGRARLALSAPLQLSQPDGRLLSALEILFWAEVENNATSSSTHNGPSSLILVWHSACKYLKNVHMICMYT